MSRLYKVELVTHISHFHTFVIGDDDDIQEVAEEFDWAFADEVYEDEEFFITDITDQDV